MSPKGWLGSIRDRSLNLQERLFRLLVMIGLFGLAVEIIDGIMTGDDIMSTILLSITLVLFLCIYFFATHFHKIQLGAVIIAFALIFAVLPYVFLTSGAIYGGAPLWFLFGMVYVCLVVEGRVRYILLVSSFVMNVGCYYIAYTYPSLVGQRTRETAHIDSIVSMFIVAILICGMILFQNTIYRSENAIAREQNREIEELNREQNRFFSSMSHEIRTPINTIIGLNELILRKDVSDEVAANAINVQGASRMLLSLLNDFLDMSRIESGKMDIVPVAYDVGAMLSDIVNMVWVRAREKGLEFHVDVDKAVPAQLIGDEVRIKQILINVLNNAVKYTETGSVTLSIQSRGQEADTVFISYSITDTGMGIKKENIPYLFSAYKRVDEEKNRHIEGTGLGLSIVKQLVDLMGGDIAVDSIYTKGSTFVIDLPQKLAGEAKIGKYDPGSKYNHSAREHYKQSFEAPKAHVLIVDDNEMNLEVAKRLLKDTRLQIDTAISGAECLKKTICSRYDVILMDHIMPGMDGIECMHEIRTQTGGLNQNTPIVSLTANAGGENQALYRREGFDGYLPKPVSGIQLEEEILKHLPREHVSITDAGGSVGVVETSVPVHKKKLPVMITTESVCDLPENLVEKHQIAVMPYRVVTDDGEFLDGIEAETDGILSYISGRGKHVRSEEASVADCEEFFAEQMARAQNIVHITMAKHVSQGYANALEASKNFDNVIVIDSGHLSSGMGLVVLQAANYAAEGMSAEAIAHELEAMKGRVRTSFIVNSTEYLAQSGRLAPKIHAVCQALMLHPVIVLKNSSMKVGAIRIGEKDYVRKKYIVSALNSPGRIDTEILFITYAGLTKEELKDIEEQVKRKVAFQDVICQKASPAISTNCGPGSFGLIFMTR